MDGFLSKEALALTDADLAPNGKLRSIEKAKANHLIKQLQMRLQYARLKVDHGWQKQRLNEVENLYFRQQKQSESPVKSAYPTTALLTAPLDPQILAQSQPEDLASGPNSSLSFRLPADAPTLHEHPNGTGGSQWLNDATMTHVGPSNQTQTPPPPQRQPQADDLSAWVHDAPDPVPTPQDPSSTAPASFTATQSQFQSLPSSRPQHVQQHFAPSAASASASAPVSSSPMTMTYDSFWSSTTTGSSAVPLPYDWQTTGPAPMFTAPRNGNAKGKGRVAGGSGIVKRKTTQSPVRVAQPG
ncbi:hypothetical protein DFH08DRAFT_892930 [Mycena albidolilacea]|uniref:Uncharacterized protein n=1 Tax=Mycena albidolilacea TaxID=1033008 RepID=A0AAD6ZDI6_9AGAR|nr:hypothetical protein DFH08DRAFT_892930 [Mycena albidolilacea]